MRAVLLDVPEALLRERRLRGLDRRDEMWDGELHMAPPPSDAHQDLAGSLFRVLAPLAERMGLRPRYETGLFAADDDYRVPDQVYARPERFSDRGVEGAADLVVEIRSPGDETYAKLDWYAARGVPELLVVVPDPRAVELYVNRGGRLLPVQGDDDGVRSAVLDAWFAVRGGRLHIAWAGGSAEV